MILDKTLLDKLSDQAKENVRLRMNYNLHDSLESKSQRLFNALEPGTFLPIHRHVHSSETYILIRGSLSVTLFDDEMKVIEYADLSLTTNNFGIQIPANTWHEVVVNESGTVIFEVKDGPYTPLSSSDIMEK